MDLSELLLFSFKSGGSDLHVSAGAPLMIRCSGEMRKLAMPGSNKASVLEADDVRRLIYDILTDAQKKELEARKELDFAVSVGSEARFRGNCYFQTRGMGAVFRTIPTKILTLDDIGAPDVIRRFAELEKGLVLITGGTGSGKSTTLAAVIDQINKTRKGHILTIEDPVEFVHEPRSCLVNQREVGSHTLSFKNSLKGALRQDPDVILVGEMRDYETVSMAVEAAETGHVVFGTLHTASAVKTVDRVVGVFPSEEQPQIQAMLAESLKGVVAQLLLKKVGGGRCAALEILVSTQGIRAMIRDGKLHQLPSAMQTGMKYGMQTMQQAVKKLIKDGLVNKKVAAEKLKAVGIDFDPDAP